jgi:uncharacterized cupredoxin-like copper-binding protein
MTSLQRNTISVIAALTGVALLATGCNSAKQSTPGGRSPKGSPGVSGSATTVAVTEKEFSIALSKSTFTPGTYTFKVTNSGKFPHNLTIQGPGVDHAASPTLPGGKSGKVTVSFRAGSYELWCSVDSHKEKGMDLKIRVA